MFTSGTKWLPIVLLLAMMLVVCGCKSNGAASGPVTEEELSYRNDPLLDDGVVPATSYLDAEPGESTTIARSFENAPPMIPHSLEDLLPITIDENSCVECHLPDVAEDFGATAVPASMPTISHCSGCSPDRSPSSAHWRSWQRRSRPPPAVATSTPPVPWRMTGGAS